MPSLIDPPARFIHYAEQCASHMFKGCVVFQQAIPMYRFASRDVAFTDLSQAEHHGYMFLVFNDDDVFAGRLALGMDRTPPLMYVVKGILPEPVAAAIDGLWNNEQTVDIRFVEDQWLRMSYFWFTGQPPAQDRLVSPDAPAILTPADVTAIADSQRKRLALSLAGWSPTVG